MTTWEPQDKLEGQAVIAYDDADTAYDQEGMQYNGKQQPVWTPQDKS